MGQNYSPWYIIQSFSEHVKTYFLTLFHEEWKALWRSICRLNGSGCTQNPQIRRNLYVPSHFCISQRKGKVIWIENVFMNFKEEKSMAIRIWGFHSCYLQLIAASTLIRMHPDGLHPDTSRRTCIWWDNSDLGRRAWKHPPKMSYLPWISKWCWRCLEAYQEAQKVIFWLYDQTMFSNQKGTFTWQTDIPSANYFCII